MAVSKLVNGFDCEFAEKPPEMIQTECLICLLILREPYQVICCGKSFCHSCIERVKSLSKPCPHCNEKNFTDFPNKGLQQPLYQLQIRCTHQNEGCKWTGELGALDNHLNLDTQPANQLKGCFFVTVKCTHCSESQQRQHINRHQSEVCPKRPFTCELCKDYKSTFEDVTTNHWSVCGCYPVPCSNKCGAVLQRQNIKSHVAKDCPLIAIKCDFHYVGCEVRLPCKNMGEHLRVELVTHVSMMAVSYQQRMDELVKENEALKQRVSELEREQVTDRALIRTMYDSILPVDIIMPNFEQHKKNNDEWLSPPFYTHHRGYKLFLGCYANGLIVKNHVSVYFHMMRGEFDDELKWPFRGEITLQLLSQDGSSEHYTKTSTHVYFSRVTEGDKTSFGFGKCDFIFPTLCYKQCIHNDSLHFRIVKIL